MHQSLEIYYEKADYCPLRDRQFNFFEFVYVISGNGRHSINGNTVVFGKGDLFLITPDDRHQFDLDGTCEFMLIRFAPCYVNNYSWKSIDHIECLLYHASHLSGSVLVNRRDREIAEMLAMQLLTAIEQDNLYNEDLSRHLVNALIVIAARNIAIVKPGYIAPSADRKILDIIDYIQVNICYPDRLKIAVIAQKFGLSATYLGSYFRKQCGETIQQYIASYRIRLIEHRLRFSDKRVYEIADEFGFTDESHINKFFRKSKSMTLRAYRELNRN